MGTLPKYDRNIGLHVCFHRHILGGLGWGGSAETRAERGGNPYEKFLTSSINFAHTSSGSQMRRM